jgi:uncharacterized protein (TIGR02271 family)
MSIMVTCTTRDSAQAEALVDRLKAEGISKNDISALLPDTRETRDFSKNVGTKAPEGAAAGIGTGGLLGGGLGWLVGIGALAIPGLGPFIAAGPIMATLGGAAVGATIGGVAGALIGIGFTEHEARRYENLVKGGRPLLTVRASDRAQAERIERLFRDGGASDISMSGDEDRPAARTHGRRNLAALIGYSVVDREGSKVGTVENLWEDPSGEPEYLGVRTGWLGLGKAHVLPAFAAEVTEQGRKIRLPIAADVVRGAPAFDSDEEITDDGERRILDYYEMHGLRPEEREPRAAVMPEAPPAPVETPAPAEPVHAMPPDEQSLQLKREEMVVGKREVPAGGVRVRKVVRTDTVDQPVELAHEEIVIDRTEGGSVAEVGDAEFREEEIYVPLKREVPVVEKQTRVDEEVRVRKEVRTERQDVSGAVRREQVEVDDTSTTGPERSTPDQARPSRPLPTEPQKKP